MDTLLFEMINFAPIIHKSIINLVTNVLKKKKSLRQEMLIDTTN